MSTKTAGAGRIVSHELPAFSRKLSAMLSSGLPVVNAVVSLGKQSSSSSFRAVLRGVHMHLESGETLADSMKHYPDVFSPLYINMIAAGEAGGRLPESTARLASFLEAGTLMRRKIRMAMMYPSIVLGIAAVVVTGMVTFVLPRFAELYSSNDADLPSPTQFLMDISEFIRDSWIEIAVAAGILFLFFRFWKSSSGGAIFFDRIKLKLPVFGHLNRKIISSRFARTYGELIASGIAVPAAVKISASATGNAVAAAALMNSIYIIESGEPLSEAIKTSGVFPVELLEMLQAGEKSGRVDEMLNNIANYYDDEVDAALGGLTAMLNPILVLILGLIIGGLVICMFLPVLKLPSIL